jgi:hypothetical protein
MHWVKFSWLAPVEPLGCCNQNAVAEATAPRVFPLGRVAIEALPLVGWPTVGVDRDDGSGNEAKSDNRHDHSQPH